jgi:hypothetical protein
MNPPALLIRAFIISLSLVAVVPACAASAQPAGYVTVSGFGDIRQISNSTTFSPYGSGADSSLDATGAGGGVRVGTFLHSRWSLELGLDVATKETIDIEDPFVILIYPPVPRTSRKSSTSFLNVSTTVGFHPPPIGRVRLGYRAGFAFVKGTYTSEYPIYVLPTDFFSGTGLTGFDFGRGPSAGIGSFVFEAVGSQRAPTAMQTHNAGALTMAFDAAVDLTNRLSLVPEIRALAFSTPGAGAGVFLIRPGVGVRWNF